MSLYRSICYTFYPRRRRKSYLFLMIFVILLYYYYQFLELSSYPTEITIISEDFDKLQNRFLEKSSEIFSKYLRSPYEINIWRIINESNAKYADKSSNNKYLVYSCPFMCGGWGDRTRKIVAAFLLSLALNRTFLLDMTWPCSIEQYLTANLISWSISSHLHVKNLSSAINITSLASTDHRLLESYHQQYSVLYIQTKNIAYFDLFSKYSLFYEVLFTRFRIKREHIQIITLYPLLYDLLIKLQPNLQDKLDRLNLTDSDQDALLCGHIRIGRNPSNLKDVVFPHREKMNVTVLNFLRSRPGRVFITTDSGEVQHLARQLFSTKSPQENSRLIEINGTIAHIDRDWNYLACETVISKSSFGHLAIHRRIYPYEELYLYCNGIKTIQNSNDYDRYKYSTC
ncbi:unnamed protein product [Adineta ricciae]|uniref:Uncharacterized protein n=1 Tax=Adineta ricciae TaxID=249248 RepID=A0A815LH32_ADIRI|nr:unnamed protein product [Adineta ricciae]